MGKSLIIKAADFSNVAINKIEQIVDKIAITVIASPTNGGRVSGSGSYEEGEEILITASPLLGYAFTQWDDGDTNMSRTITVPSEPKTYTALFERSSNLYITEDNVEINQGQYLNYNNGMSATLATWNRTSLFEIPSGYTRIKGSTNAYPTAASVAFYTDEKTYISGVAGGSTGVTAMIEVNKEIPSNAKYIALCWQKSGESNNIDFPNLYFE